MVEFNYINCPHCNILLKSEMWNYDHDKMIPLGVIKCICGINFYLLNHFTRIYVLYIRDVFFYDGTLVECCKAYKLKAFV